MGFFRHDFVFIKEYIIIIHIFCKIFYTFRENKRLPLKRSPCIYAVGLLFSSVSGSSSRPGSAQGSFQNQFLINVEYLSVILYRKSFQCFHGFTHTTPTFTAELYSPVVFNLRNDAVHFISYIISAVRQSIYNI